MITCGLDLAQLAGIAWKRDYDSTFFVTECKGDPEEQYAKVNRILNSDPDAVCLIEQFVYFSPKNSIKTQTTLLKHIGVFEYLLTQKYKPPVELNVQTVRAKYFKPIKGVKKKIQCRDFFRNEYSLPFTDNHTDALLMVLYYLDIQTITDLDIKIV